MPRFFPLFSLMLSLFASSFAAQAEGFGINATRLIYPQGAPSISVTVRNTLAATPYLVQTGISRMQHKYEPAPFSVTPPLFRLEAGSTNQIRIVAQNVNAPNNHESVFFFMPAQFLPAPCPSRVINVQASVEQYNLASAILSSCFTARQDCHRHPPRHSGICNSPG